MFPAQLEPGDYDFNLFKEIPVAAGIMREGENLSTASRF